MQHSRATTTKTNSAESNLTVAQQQAIGSAQDYTSYSALSRLGLIQRLSSKAGEGFTLAQARYGAKKVGLC